MSVADGSLDGRRPSLDYFTARFVGGGEAVTTALLILSIDQFSKLTTRAIAAWFAQSDIRSSAIRLHNDLASCG